MEELVGVAVIAVTLTVSHLSLISFFISELVDLQKTISFSLKA